MPKRRKAQAKVGGLTAAQATALLEWRRKHDPLTTYVPGLTQGKCYHSRARVRLLSGNNRSGKTSHSCVEIAQAAMRKHKIRTTSVNGIYIVFAISREQITDVWYQKLRVECRLKGDGFKRPLIPDWEVEREYFTHGAGRPTIREISLKNGHRILFAVSGDKHSWERVQGKDYVLGVAIDEQAGEQKLIDECLSRMLDANSDEVVRREAGGAWLLWSTSETLVNPAWDGMRSRADAGNPEVDYFFIGADENPAISLDERHKMKDLMSDDAYSIRMEGQGSQSGQMLVYPQFNDAIHVRQDDYVPTDTDSIWIGYDPGTNYTGIVFAAFSKDKPLKARVFKCLQPRRQTLESDVQDICDVLRGRFAEALVYDQAARKVEKVGDSVRMKLQRLLNERGVILKRGMLMGESLYERGIPRMRHYLAPKPGDLTAEPLIELNSSPDSGVQRLRQQLRSYRFTNNAHELKGDNIQRGDDHLLDAFRYMITRQPCWVDRGKNPMNPHYAVQLKREPLVMSEMELEEKRKEDASAMIAKGRLPNHTSRANVNWRR